MLTIGKLGIGQENYYLDKVAEGAEDYYSGEGEAEGSWMGHAAEELGLDGEVGPVRLTEVLVGGRGSRLLGRANRASLSGARCSLWPELA